MTAYVIEQVAQRRVEIRHGGDEVGVRYLLLERKIAVLAQVEVGDLEDRYVAVIVIFIACVERGRLAVIFLGRCSAPNAERPRPGRVLRLSHRPTFPARVSSIRASRTFGAVAER